FARTGHESRHNLKYWTRQPYLGFGVDAHSMLQAKAGMKAENQEGRRALTGCEQTSADGIDCEQMPVPSLAGKGPSSLVPPGCFLWRCICGGVLDSNFRMRRAGSAGAQQRRYSFNLPWPAAVERSFRQVPYTY